MYTYGYDTVLVLVLMYHTKLNVKTNDVSRDERPVVVPSEPRCQENAFN